MKSRYPGLAVARVGGIIHLVTRVANKEIATGAIGDRPKSIECRTAEMGNVLAVFRREARRLRRPSRHRSMFILFRKQRPSKMSQLRSSLVRSHILFTRWLACFCRNPSVTTLG